MCGRDSRRHIPPALWPIEMLRKSDAISSIITEVYICRYFSKEEP